MIGLSAHAHVGALPIVIEKLAFPENDQFNLKPYISISVCVG